LVAFSVVTANTVNGANLFYSVFPVTANVTADDFYANIGVVTITNNAGLFVLRANTNIAPMDETGETFRIQLRTADNIGNIVYVTSNVAILDTDKTYNTLGFTSSSSAVTESSNVTFTYTATNIPSGTILHYSTTGNLTSFVSNTGSFLLNSSSNTFVIATGAVSFNAIRSFNVVLRTGSAQGAIFATSNNITVSSTSLVPMTATGGVQSNVGSYRIHTFTSSGAITFGKSGDIEYLIVGGGGGAQSIGGGGGGGGLLLSGVNDSTKFTAAGGTPYSIVIGSGGSTNTAGTPTTGLGLTAYGGGNGGNGNGGSGGRGGKGVYIGSPYISAPRQGYDGGVLAGGGAGGAGSPVPAFATGAGAGYNSSFTGSPYTYSEGGGGTDGNSYYSMPPSAGPFTNTGGYGGGGSGAYSNPGGGYSGPGFAAIKYYTSTPTFLSVNVVVIANVFDTFAYEGANITLRLNTLGLQNNTLFYYSTVGNADASFFVSSNVGSFRTTFDTTTIVSLQTNTNIPTNEERSFQLKIASEPGSSADALFTSNIFTIKDTGLEPRASVVEYLVVAGGGAGGTRHAGGGGAGGFRTASGFSVTPGTPYIITVGAGGAANAGALTGSTGNSSVFSTITSLGGGGGAYSYPGPTSKNGGPGGSGGGGGYDGSVAGTPGAGTPGQGNSGGNGTISSPYSGAGGGGAGAVGGNSNTGGGSGGGAGGAGTATSISGSATFYAGGGGGGGYTGANPVALGGAGGTGGGGAGSAGDTVATAGTTNTGGGGGGSGGYPGNGSGANGGSGIVIVRYPDTLATAAATTGSPNVIYANANIIYRFWQSGSITF
jgi:hypothetical protein